MYELMRSRRYVELRQQIGASADRRQLLRDPLASAYYGAAICLSPRETVAREDLKTATQYIDYAAAELGPASVAWLRQAERNCLLSDVLLALGTVTVQIQSVYSGKMPLSCDVARPKDESPRWFPIDSKSPPESFLDDARGRHAGPARVDVCAPFVALSSSNPGEICGAAQEFWQYFQREYKAEPPAAWIEIHHYESHDALLEHVQRNDGPRCLGSRGEELVRHSILGYFDPRSQAVAYRARAGLYGTMNHELAHALVFWDAQGLPQWFEEGFASLYENTRGNYEGVPNPWREALLRDAGVRYSKAQVANIVHMSDTQDILRMPVAHSLSRAMMLEIQKAGALPRLYQWARCFTAEDAEVAAVEWQNVIYAALDGRVDVPASCGEDSAGATVPWDDQVVVPRPPDPAPVPDVDHESTLQPGTPPSPTTTSEPPPASPSTDGRGCRISSAAFAWGGWVVALLSLLTIRRRNRTK